jgi:hypothetical protein
MRITRNAQAVAAPDGRTLEVTLVPWNTIARVSDDGRTHYAEQWAPGSLVAGDGVAYVWRGHTVTANGPKHGPLIGRVASVDASAQAGPAAVLELADTADGREVHALAGLVGAEVSIEADVTDTPADAHGVVTRTAANPGRLMGVAVMLPPERGAFMQGAAVTAVRTQGDPTMSDTPTEPEDPETPDPEPEMRISRAAVAEAVRAELARVRLPQLGENTHPLARFRTFVDFADAAYTDKELSRYISRAWVDQITTDNASLVRPAWLSEIYGIVDFGRPLIDAIGTATLPDSGMSVEWPVYAGDLSLLVLEQTTQKTDIASVKVSFTNMNAPIKTYAGGSDISYQLIRRSSPAYRDAYLRVMAAAYALRTDYAASAALEALVVGGATQWVAYDPATADPGGELLRSAVFSASVLVENATGAPATVLLAATDVFIKLGGKVQPNTNPVQNVGGTGTAAGLDLNISGLRVVHARYLPTGRLIETNGMAAQWREDGPMVISAPDVQRLGEDTAIWGMGVTTATVPMGLVALAATDPSP